MKTEFFIISHKDADFPHINGYNTLLVGAKQNVVKNSFDYRDDMGDNISEKNKNFCELTGIYWLWKNRTNDNIGICHYRRYYTNYRFSNSSKGFVSTSDAENLLDRYDIIIPKKYYCATSMLDSIDKAPNLADMDEVKKVITLLCPEYLRSYEDFMEQNTMYLYNMVIMKKSLFDNYCEWLFNILFYIESDYDISHEDTYRSRLLGFLSERLLYVWVSYNIQPDKVKEMRVVNTDVPPLKSFMRQLKNRYRDICWKISKY